MQCIYGTPNTLTMAVRALGLVLLFSFVAALSGLPLTPPDSTANAQEKHTLSTELQPPPPLNEKEHHATIYVINMYAVKNISGSTSEEMFDNEIIETVPDIMEPFTVVLLVVDGDEDEEVGKHSAADLDEFAKQLEDEAIQIDKINLSNNKKLLRVKLHKTYAQSMIDAAAKPGDLKKDRKKRSICMKCGSGGYPNYQPSGGGYYQPSSGGHYQPSGGGYYQPSGGGYYQPSGGDYCSTCGRRHSRRRPSGGGGGGGGGGYQIVIPVAVGVIPITGGGKRGFGGGGHGGGRYPSGGGGGCNTCGGGGGGGYGGSGSYSQSSASAQSSSGSWGGK